MRFAGKTVLVAGGGSGIGRAIATAFAGEGANVVVSGRDRETLERVTADLGPKVHHVVGDVTTDAQRMVDAAVNRFGGLDIAVNNAGILGTPGPAADIDEDVFDQVIATNLTGLWLCMKHEIAHMRANDGGAIVNISSNIGAHARRKGMAAYAASKAAVSALTRTAALDHIGDGVRINAVSPGASDTTMSRRPGETTEDRDARVATTVPLGRVGRTEEIANAVLWLASDEASSAVGHDLVLDGGATA